MGLFDKEFKQIREDVKRIQKTFQSELSTRAENDLVQAHHDIITAFYADYTPGKRKSSKGKYYYSYHRHYGLRYTLIKHKKRKGGKGAYIIVGDTNMEEVYRAKAETVFDYMWDKGIRGLPYKGSAALTKSYTFQGNSFNKGDIWINPYWSGESEPYKNIFMPSFTFGEYSTKGTPHDIMSDLVENWDKAYGYKYCDEIEKMIT